jgi:hypothetical protein
MYFPSKEIQVCHNPLSSILILARTVALMEIYIQEKQKERGYQVMYPSCVSLDRGCSGWNIS